MQEDLRDPRVARVVAAGRALGATVRPVRFPAGTRTAVDAARAVGCELGQIVKTLLFLGPDEAPHIFFVSGSNRLDPVKGAAAADVEALTKADAGSTKKATGFSIGGVPPFGHPSPVPAVMDRDLLDYDEVWAAAGLPDAVFPIAPETLREVTQARIADVAADPDPR